MEPLLMIRPPDGSWVFISRTAARVQRNIPVRLTSTVARQSATAISSTSPDGPKVPALFTSRSSRPQASRTAAKASSTCRSSVTSAGSTRVVPPVAAVPSNAARVRPRSATDHPSSARARPMARPSPEPAPVTTAVRNGSAAGGAATGRACHGRARPARPCQPGRMPVPWVHAFVDVPADRADVAREFWSAVTGWPPGEPWPGHPEFVSLVPPSGAPYLHVQLIGGPSRVHLDLLGSPVDDVPRLAGLGAEPGRVGDGWRVMTSPA